MFTADILADLAIGIVVKQFESGIAGIDIEQGIAQVVGVDNKDTIEERYDLVDKNLNLADHFPLSTYKASRIRKMNPSCHSGNKQDNKLTGKSSRVLHG